ncbi:MAG: glycerol-3-phosphate acyltransferase, partial [Wolbachia endosymbiont of Hylaeus sinuatus]|nr:glycerol-3-phosphate acyltransferase [Wolbachia endosymbiont of Hylaeus sinuatus]
MEKYVVLILSYILGSIPFSLIITRIKGINLREVGSGNIGATNVARTGNKFLAALALFL